MGQINSEMSGTAWSIWNAAFINILAALSQTNLFYGHGELLLLMYWDDYLATLLFFETGILNVSWGSVLVFHISLCLKTWITKSPYLCAIYQEISTWFFLALSRYRSYCYPVDSWSNHINTTRKRLKIVDKRLESNQVTKHLSALQTTIYYSRANYKDKIAD